MPAWTSRFFSAGRPSVESYGPNAREGRGCGDRRQRRLADGRLTFRFVVPEVNAHDYINDAQGHIADPQLFHDSNGRGAEAAAG